MKIARILLLTTLFGLASGRVGDEADQQQQQRELKNDKNTKNIPPGQAKKVDFVPPGQGKKEPLPPTSNAALGPVGPDGIVPDSTPTFPGKSDSDNGNGKDPNKLKLLVGFKNNNGKNKIKVKANKVNKEFKRFNFIAVEATATEAEELAKDPDVAYVEEDSEVFMTSNWNGGYIDGTDEWESYSVRQTLANSPNFLPHSTPGDCSDPNSFKLAIIDSGVRADHPDSPCVPDSNGGYVNCMGDSFGVPDAWDTAYQGWHGTHVFGIAAATGGNGEGVVGMNPEGDGICYMHGRVFGEFSPGGGWSYIIAAVEWALDNGANVINLSLSGGYSTSGQAAFAAVAAEGALAVAAAGNSGSFQYEYPSSWNNVISVSAVNANDFWASFSTYNYAVNICAPGDSIWGMHTQDTITDYGPYKYASGTSMAAPHVSGAITKAWSRCPSCSASTVESCLYSSADYLGYEYVYGMGVVKAEGLYDCLQGQTSCTCI